MADHVYIQDIAAQEIASRLADVNLCNGVLSVLAKNVFDTGSIPVILGD